MKKLLCILLIIAGFGAKAQENFSITGTVTDTKGAVVPRAIVFLSNSKKTTSTNADGVFTLSELRPGAYELTAKMMGYDALSQTITIQNQNVRVNMKLTESSTTLNEVVIKGKIDPTRQKYMQQFVKNFIGHSANAASCKILNPDAIHFHYDKQTDILEAKSNDFIIVENKALGYIVKYLLNDFQFNTNTNAFSFTGKPYFEDMKATSDGELKQWDLNRKVAYEGSIQHFFKALFNNTATDEGFLIYQLTNDKTAQVAIAHPMHSTAGYHDLKRTDRAGTIDPEKLSLVKPELLYTAPDKDFKILNLRSARDKDDNNKKLYVVYTKEGEPSAFYNTDGHIDFPAISSPGIKSQISQIISFADDLVLDKNGSLSPAPQWTASSRRQTSLSFAGSW